MPAEGQGKKEHVREQRDVTGWSAVMLINYNLTRDRLSVDLYMQNVDDHPKVQIASSIVISIVKIACSPVQ